MNQEEQETIYLDLKTEDIQDFLTMTDISKPGFTLAGKRMAEKYGFSFRKFKAGTIKLKWQNMTGIATDVIR